MTVKRRRFVTRRRRRVRKILTVVLILGVIGAIIAALFTVPLSHRFSGTIQTTFCSGCTPTVWNGSANESVPKYATVSFSWSAADDALVNFSVLWGPANSTVLCEQNADSGSCSFTSHGGTYTLFAKDYGNELAVNVSFSGGYARPLA